MVRPKIELEKMTWLELAQLIDDIWSEMKRRNPIGINFYNALFKHAASALRTIGHAERSHRTSEAGPR